MEMASPIVILVIADRCVKRLPPPSIPVGYVVLRVNPMPPSIDLGHPKDVNFPFQAKVIEPAILVTIPPFGQ